MKDERLYTTQLRLNLQNADHKEACEILRSLPPGQSITSFVVQAVLRCAGPDRPSPNMETENTQGLLRCILREELEAYFEGRPLQDGMVRKSESGVKVPGPEGFEDDESPLSEDTLEDLESILGLDT